MSRPLILVAVGTPINPVRSGSMSSPPSGDEAWFIGCG